MKKNKIFDLKYSEIIELMREIIKKPFGRQYFMLVSFVVIIAILSVFSFVFCIAMHLLKGSQVNYMVLLLTILISFMLLVMSLLAKIKWMDFIKEYFDKKNV